VSHANRIARDSTMNDAVPVGHHILLDLDPSESATELVKSNTKAAIS
jgi:hypothetical protein